MLFAILKKHEKQKINNFNKLRYRLTTKYLGRNTDSMMQIITNEINHSDSMFKVLENATG